MTDGSDHTNAAAQDSALLPGHPGQRRRLIARSASRVGATSLGLLLLYAFVPVPGSSRVGPILGLVAGVVVFLAIVAAQIRSIVRSDRPLLRSIEVLTFAVLLLVVVFAFTYLSLSRNDPASFSEHLDRVDAMYYTVSTVSTVGPGDITPATTTARVLVTVQMLITVILVGFVVRLVILAMRTGLRRRGLSPTDAD